MIQAPPSLFDFTLNDLNLLIGGHEDHEDAPSIIWTEASVQSTLASVISTDPSIISTQASVTSTVPSVLIIEEVDLRDEDHLLPRQELSGHLYPDTCLQTIDTKYHSFPPTLDR